MTFKKAPKFLYKYRSINKYTLDNLLNETLWFSDVNSFNDPAEFNFNIEKGDEFKKVGKEVFRENFVFCCAENNNIVVKKKDENILLWSHYADSHKGICIEYELENFTYLEKSSCYFVEEGLMLLKTLYKKNSPNFSPENIRRILSTKFEQWEYEKEWRFLAYKKGNVLSQKSCFERISSIIFGDRASDADIAMIKKIFENRKDRPDFKRAKFDTVGNFLNIEDLEKKR